MHINASTWSASVSAFLNSKTNFKTVKIGASVSSITGNPFTGATGITTFANASSTFSLSGTTILLNDTTLIAYINGTGTSATLSYKTIGNGANIFTNPTAITTVTLSSTTSGSLVGASAFNGCTSLSTVSIARPDVWTGTMGASAFQSKAITLTLTGNYAPTTNLTNALPNVSGSTLELNFATINDTKFVTFLNAKSNYTTVKIGSSVTDITNNPFTGATSVTAFTGNTTFTTADSNKSLLSGTKLIAHANGSGASATLSYKTIGNGANIFTNPTAITTVTLSSTTSGSLVGASAFNGCTALATVSIARPDVWSGTMGANAFQSKAITLTLTGNYAPATNLINALPNTSGSTLHLNISGTWSANLMPFLNAKTNYSVTASASVTAISASTFTGLTLTNASWDLISLISKYNIASNLFAVGDTKTITITDYGEATFAILGFNHDDLASGGKAGITFGMTELLESTHKMNSSESNVGGWDASEMRSTVMPSILAGMPSDLATAIKTVNKKTSIGGGNSTITTSQDKLFLFSYNELCSDGNEGSRYQYFINLESEMGGGGGYYSFLVKKLSNGSGSANYWWLRTAYTSYSTGFREVSTSGSIGSSPGPYANASFGICFGFCI